jgi:hypothetical protein
MMFFFHTYIYIYIYAHYIICLLACNYIISMKIFDKHASDDSSRYFLFFCNVKLHESSCSPFIRTGPVHCNRSVIPTRAWRPDFHQQVTPEYRNLISVRVGRVNKEMLSVLLLMEWNNWNMFHIAKVQSGINFWTEDEDNKQQWRVESITFSLTSR